MSCTKKWWLVPFQNQNGSTPFCDRPTPCCHVHAPLLRVTALHRTVSGLRSPCCSMIFLWHLAVNNDLVAASTTTSIFAVLVVLDCHQVLQLLMMFVRWEYYQSVEERQEFQLILLHFLPTKQIKSIRFVTVFVPNSTLILINYRREIWF